MTKNLKLLKFVAAFMFAIVSTTFTSCVNDNFDTEAPFLEVTPTQLTFGNNGLPTENNQNSFIIKTNRPWKAIVQDGKDWVTLSQTEGEGETTVYVSIPQGINDEASVLVQVSNKVGILLSQTVVIKSGKIEQASVIFNETTGSESVSSPYPLVGAYSNWGISGEGSSQVTFSGVNASVRASGNSNQGAYDNASGPNVIFFGNAPAQLTVNKIALNSSQTKLKLTFGANYSYKNDSGVYENEFIISALTLEVSGDGNSWTPVTYTKNSGDAEHPYWILATADFTLTEPSEYLYLRFTANESSRIRIDDITLTTGNGGQLVELPVGTPDNGGNNPGDDNIGGDDNTGGDNNPGGDSDVVTNPFLMTYDIIAANGTGDALPYNAYGAQNVASRDTWYKWRANKIDFTGVKICTATPANGGTLQVQGNASDAAKQGIITNSSAIANLEKIVITFRTVSTSKYAPDYSFYVGASADPKDNLLTPSVVEGVDGDFKTYVHTYDLSLGEYCYFNLLNNKAGALYIDSIEITTK